MPTLKQVAERAGVSLTTASFVLNNKAETHGIGASSIERVQEAANALGYQGNYHAKVLMEGRSQVIGLVMTTPLHNRMCIVKGRSKY